MIPFGNETVTLIKRVETVNNGKTAVSYSRHIIDRCSWRTVAITNRLDTQQVRSYEIVCRMPPGIAPAPEDALFLGLIESTPESSVQLDDMILRHRSSGAFRVDRVSDNTRPGFPLPHYAARGA